MYIGKRIAITGVGPIASVGSGEKEFWRGVLQPNVNIEEIHSFIGGQLWEKYFLHKVRDFNIHNFGLEETAVESITHWKEGEDNRDLYFLLAACKLALDDSNISYPGNDNDLGLVVCHENPCIEQLLRKSFNLSYDYLTLGELSKKDYFEKIYSNVMKLSYETQSFMVLFHIARVFGIHNYSLFVNNACSSGMYALEVASDMIKLGKAKRVIVAASDCPDVYKHIWFKKLNMYASDGLTKPFDKNADGFILGECGAAIIVEEMDSALERGAKIYAEYSGGGFRLESWGITTPKLGDEYYHDAIRQSLMKSGLTKNDVDLVCAHGVGSNLSDVYEAKAINDVFDGREIRVAAFKPYVGHCLGASNLIEIIILLLCLKNQIVIPVLNLRGINPKTKLNLVIKQEECQINYVMKTCSAFAGFCSSAVFKKFNRECNSLS